MKRSSWIVLFSISCLRLGLFAKDANSRTGVTLSYYVFDPSVMDISLSLVSVTINGHFHLRGNSRKTRTMSKCCMRYFVAGLAMIKCTL